MPWAAGGGTDAVARQIAHMLERDLKHIDRKEHSSWDYAEELNDTDRDRST